MRAIRTQFQIRCNTQSGAINPLGKLTLFLALMRNRVNFPGMPKPNWTYGVLWLFHGCLPKAE